MSKLDAVRAMREARYAEAQDRAGSAARPAPRQAPKPAAKPAPEPTAESAAESAAEAAPAAAATDDLCGHRNMSGRTCTRERGHSAKSHRYS